MASMSTLSALLHTTSLTKLKKLLQEEFGSDIYLKKLKKLKRFFLLAGAIGLRRLI